MADITACLSTGKDDWETPDGLFAFYDNAYHFVLDAAANETNHKVPSWFGPGGEQADALSVEWPLEQGNIWLNPPYSRGLQGAFVRKAVAEVLRLGLGAGREHYVVCLLPARTDTKLFHEVIVPNATQIEFLKGRVKFLEHYPQCWDDFNGELMPDRKESPGPAPFPSMIVVF